MNNWEDIAHYCEETYGTLVNWTERFFLCPECGEPIYECDWNDENFDGCPVCGW